MERPFKVTLTPKYTPHSLSLQLGLQYHIYIVHKSSHWTKCWVRGEPWLRFTTGWQCFSRNKHCRSSDWVLICWPSLKECCFKDPFVPTPFKNEAVSFNENHLVCQEQVDAKHLVSFPFPNGNLTNFTFKNSVQPKINASFRCNKRIKS